ncbi:MAG: tetratricopeptide repeat protein [Thermotogaceae bacterium]|nr:tetratricopeptide repeat protein [Thermotogaceae bacterium]
MNTIERIVRSLIKEGKLSRARALLSIFGEDYPHLVLELEIAAGNYEGALDIYEKLPEEVKREYESTIDDIKKLVETREYKENFKDAISEYVKGNYQGAVALLEGITRDYPELVEAIALKYETYIKTGNTSKAKELEEILRRFDVSHPALIESKPSRTGLNFPVLATVVTLVVIVVVLGVMILSNIYSVSSAESKVADTVRVELKHELSMQISALSSEIKNLEKNLETKIRENTRKLDELYEKAGLIEEVQNNLISSIEEKFNQEGKNRVLGVPDLDKVASDTGEILKNVNLTLNKLDFVKESLITLESSVTNLYYLVMRQQAVFPSLKSILVPDEIIYKPSSELDKAKIYWLSGYIMYLKNQYDDAIELFHESLKIVDVLYPHVYFHDDCIYYLGLSYYMNMEYDKAKRYFELLKKEFPESQYIDDAEFFMKSISGGE